MQKAYTIAVSAISDFIITAGTAYAVAAAGGSTLPSKAQIVAILIGGLVQAARGVQKTLSPPP